MYLFYFVPEGYGSAKEGRCSPPGQLKNCVKGKLLSPPGGCDMDRDCPGTKKCCKNRCGQYVCAPAKLPPIPILGKKKVYSVIQ